MRELWQEIRVLSGSPFNPNTPQLGIFPSPIAISYNLIFYCTECGEIYGARCPMPHVHNWFYFGTSCRHHATISRFCKEGGGFLISLSDDEACLPRALMLHDLEVASDIWRKDYERNCSSELAAFAAYAKLKSSEFAKAGVRA